MKKNSLLPIVSEAERTVVAQATNRMLSDQLRYFLAAASHEHIGHAADELSLSQPALSRSIQKLEDELGVQLFDRGGRGVRLNPAGKILLHRVERARIEFEDAVRELRDHSSVIRKTIAIGYLTTFSVRLMPELMKEFCKTEPDVQFKPFEGPSPVLKEQLLKGEIDLCVSSRFTDSSLTTDPVLEWRPLFQDELFALVPPNHRLAERKSIELRELIDEPFVALKPGHDLRVTLEQLCLEAGFLPKIIFEGYEVASLRGLVGAGFGVTLAPKREVAARTQAISIPVLSPRCFRVIGLSRRRARWLSPKTAAFMQYITKHLDTFPIQAVGV